MVEIVRRTFTKLAGVSAASAAIPVAAFPLAPNTIRLNDGSVHPVSPRWYQRNVVKAQVARENEGRRQAILEIGNERPLTDKLRAELSALTEFKNVHNARKHLGGRDYREIFGANATLDQVHMNRVTKKCGCVLNYVFDHNVRHGTNITIYPHYPTKVCTEHAHFGRDFRAQFESVMRG